MRRWKSGPGGAEQAARNKFVSGGGGDDVASWRVGCGSAARIDVRAEGETELQTANKFVRSDAEQFAAERATAEPLERTAETDGNADQQSTHRMQSVSQAVARVRKTLAVVSRARSRMRESWERGTLSKGRPYCDRALLNPAPRTREVSQLGWLALVVGAALAILLLNVARLKVIDLNQAALGGQTTAVLAEVDGLRVACFDATDSEACESAYQRAGRMPTILWLGNSQNFAINRYQPGDELATVMVHRWLKSKGTWLVSYVQPNANLYEDALLFEALAHRYNTRMVILPIFMDKLREQGIRETVAAFMQEPKTAERVRSSPAWTDLSPMLVQKGEPRAVLPSIQERVEAKLNGVLDQYWPLWRDRPILSGNLAFALRTLRNKVFGIHSYTKRPVDPKVYAEKLEVLARLLESAKRQNIRVLLYIPPYRRDIAGPYDDARYAQFKLDVASLAARYQAYFADLDGVVPGPFWATITDALFGFQEPDFMHFTAAGHRLLAKAIERRLIDLGY